MRNQQIEDSIVSGDTWSRSWRLADPDYNPINLAGISARLQLRSLSGELKAEAGTEDGGLVVDPLNGLVSMDMPPASTSVAPGRYKWGFEVTYPNGTRQTYETGVLTVKEDPVHD